MRPNRHFVASTWYGSYRRTSAGWLTQVSVPLRELEAFRRFAGAELSQHTLLTVELTAERGEQRLCMGFLNRFPKGAAEERVDVRHYAGHKVGCCFRSTAHDLFLVSAGRGLQAATTAEGRRKIIDFLCELTYSGLRLWGPMDDTWTEQEFGTLRLEELVVRAHEPRHDLFLATTDEGELLIQEAAILAVNIVSLGRVACWTKVALEADVRISQLGRPVRTEDGRVLVPVKTDQGNGLLMIDRTRKHATMRLAHLSGGDADRFVLTSSLFPGSSVPFLVIVDRYGVSFEVINKTSDYAPYATALLRERVIA